MISIQMVVTHWDLTQWFSPKQYT